MEKNKEEKVIRAYFCADIIISQIVYQKTTLVRIGKIVKYPYDV